MLRPQNWDPGRNLKGAFIPIGTLTRRFSHGLFTLARNSRRSPEDLPTGGLVAGPSKLSTMPICLRTVPQDSAMNSTTHLEMSHGVLCGWKMFTKQVSGPAGAR